MSQDLTTLSKMLDLDLQLIQAAKNKKLIAALTAEKYIAQNETADAQLNLLIAHLAIKYGLKEGDEMKEDGSFVRKAKE